MEAGEVALGLAAVAEYFIRLDQAGVLIRVDHSGEPVSVAYVHDGCGKGLLGVRRLSR